MQGRSILEFDRLHGFRTVHPDSVEFVKYFRNSSPCGSPEELRRNQSWECNNTKPEEEEDEELKRWRSNTTETNRSSIVEFDRLHGFRTVHPDSDEFLKYFPNSSPCGSPKEFRMNEPWEWNEPWENTKPEEDEELKRWRNNTTDTRRQSLLEFDRLHGFQTVHPYSDEFLKYFPNSSPCGSPKEWKLNEN